MEKRTVSIIGAVIVAVIVVVAAAMGAFNLTDEAAESGPDGSNIAIGTFDLSDRAAAADSTDHADTADPADSAERMQTRGLSTNEDRQIIISLGQDPGIISISWKGGKNDSRYLRICSDVKGLPTGLRVKAKREKLLGGRYYRYTATIRG